jgi:acetyl/propionyl-CoA carboxylase alpha subunit
MIKKILIANRGEIAVRVIRTAREMGIATVAIHSDVDAQMPHVLLADEAIALGGNSPTESYLDVTKVLAAAKESGADAIHPGYGFLSERADFADQCASAGIIFIGPSADAMRALGGKIEAKQIAVKSGVPVTPGYFEPGATDAELKKAAAEIGYPVMLKASAGGGGRGMRIVEKESDFDDACRLASEEALSGFGDGAMMVEKLVLKPRHLEVQVIADKFGNVAPLFERECSIQRRHQKLIEEAPSAYFGWDHPMWERMRDSSVSLIKNAGYYGAGTIEFMVDPVTDEFYFLEVNARLQVEHPVTEAITGLDLVRLQIEVANGANLQELIPQFLTPDRKTLNCHSIEARIVAEDPATGFMPSIGKLLAWQEPKIPGVRIDTGYGANLEVSRFYDSLLAKVIATAPTREQAIGKLITALEDLHILGVATNIGFLIDVLNHPEFVKGDIDTGFIGRNFFEWSAPEEFPSELIGLLEIAQPGQMASSGAPAKGRVAAPAWGTGDGFRNSPPA